MQVTRVANFTAGELSELETIFKEELGTIQRRLENDHLKAMAELNAVADELKDAATMVTEVRNELRRYQEMYEALVSRIEDIEREFGW